MKSTWCAWRPIGSRCARPTGSTTSCRERSCVEVPGGGDQLPSKALSAEGGGVVAVDPRDPKGAKALERMFQLDIELEAPAAVLYGGACLRAFRSRHRAARQPVVPQPAAPVPDALSCLDAAVLRADVELARRARLPRARGARAAWHDRVADWLTSRHCAPGAAPDCAIRRAVLPGSFRTPARASANSRQRRTMQLQRTPRSLAAQRCGARDFASELVGRAFALVREVAHRSDRPAPFRRAADGRLGAAAGQAGRDGDRRRQDPHRDVACMHRGARRLAGACDHGQRLSGQARRRRHGSALSRSSASRSASSRRR